jgi:predicted short-subunit dehydrogenase-like oxidoreductase (DUF2520 family)
MLLTALAFLGMRLLSLGTDLNYHSTSGHQPRVKKSQRSVTIIGLGNWGSSLAHALTAANVRLYPASAPLSADILWLCVPDAAIAAAARRLVKAHGAKLKGRIVVHSSGALNVEVLKAAAAVGASVASVHPLMSFPTRKPVGLRGVPFGVEAHPATRRTLNALIRRVGGQPFSVNGETKALYHAVGVLSSPLLVSHLVAAQQTAALAGFSPSQARKLMEPIVRATVDNVFRRGAENSVSGPIARGDGQTIRLHLQALEPHPMLADVYRALALYAVTTLPGPAKAQLKRELRRWLRQP